MAFRHYWASNKGVVGKQAISELNELISLARWHWRLLHYFKQVVNLSATCFHVELEQFSAWFRAVRVCQRQLGFLVSDHRRRFNWIDSLQLRGCTF